MTPDLSTAVWSKSSYSDGGASNCVEVADGHPAVVPVRDSKNPDGQVLVFGTTPWASFLAGLKN
ncbi:DUF397 domain-containing protein [Streptomyces sp. DT2A-34]|uniref:DUF397 domain-containing protein n=1 Tax=Streptomyces sp. DT2A-34 TaxID=3051182 RepID=UPI00265C2492|nr:DUF397 domain-containing protein [Streptomyces sp. DT2A-34]MDO0913773.1 DUF397 domain-containing protein [Streptomyces sp. DT2A-34]